MLFCGSVSWVLSSGPKSFILLSSVGSSRVFDQQLEDAYGDMTDEELTLELTKANADLARQNKTILRHEVSSTIILLFMIISYLVGYTQKGSSYSERN